MISFLLSDSSTLELPSIGVVNRSIAIITNTHVIKYVYEKIIYKKKYAVFRTD